MSARLYKRHAVPCRPVIVRHIRDAVRRERDRDGRHALRTSITVIISSAQLSCCYVGPILAVHPRPRTWVAVSLALRRWQLRAPAACAESNELACGVCLVRQAARAARHLAGCFSRSTDGAAVDDVQPGIVAAVDARHNEVDPPVLRTGFTGAVRRLHGPLRRWRPQRGLRHEMGSDQHH